MDLQGIAGLQTNFHSAATILRHWHKSNYIRVKVNEVEGPLNRFFALLLEVENHLVTKRANRPFIVLVEGLDGSGKSTLVKSLADQEYSINGSSCAAHSVRTPPVSASAVRHVFDTCDSLVTRAFYAASNYILQYEMRLISDKDPMALFFVDRWHASTCAYSVGWVTQSGGATTVNELESSIFAWPSDLDVPDLMIVLNVDHGVRRARIQYRGDVNAKNPWDSRLSADEDLAQRIVQGLKRISGPGETILVEGNQCKEEVLKLCYSLVQERANWAFAPPHMFKGDPLQLLRWMSARVGLCDPRTGFRLQDVVWDLTLSVRTEMSGQTVIRNLAIDRVDNSGIISLSASIPNGLKFIHGSCFASASFHLGSNPISSRWHANGMIRIISQQETELNRPIQCSSRVNQYSHAGESRSDKRGGCEAMPSNVAKNTGGTVSIRLVPTQMTLEVGVPDCGGTGARCFSWVRGKRSNGNGWRDAQQISGISSRNKTPLIQTIRPVTLAVLGTHTAGKETIGKRVAGFLQWTFECELGDVLREKDQLVEGGHRTGDGRGIIEQESSAWDNQVHEAECARDEATMRCRVVETWHVGNAVWAMLRNKEVGGSKDTEKEMLHRARGAIETELRKAVILFVHLQVDVETMKRRRKSPRNSMRLPMKDEALECAELHEALDKRGSELISTYSEMGIPVLRVENSTDGAEAREGAVKSILEFVNSNLWRMMA